MIDMIFSLHGTAWLMTPATPAARAWMEKNMPLGAAAHAMDARSVADFVEAAANDGLTIDLR